AVVHRRFDGADVLAGRVLAVHAGHGLEERASLLVVAIDADPVHLASRDYLLLAHRRNVVLRLAGDRAGVAADAGVEVDAHRPAIAFVGPRRIERVLRRVALEAADVGESHRAREIAPFHARMVLRR